MSRRLFSILLWLCATATAPAADPDIRELFERARMLAEQNQNLGEAIRLYGQVVQLGRTQRTLAAQAQYRQGLLYLRMGRRTDAERAFRAVIRDFADQANIVKLARSRVPGGGPPPEVRTRLVWSGDAADPFGAPSPDGRFLSFVDWTTGDLALRDFRTGENRRLTRKNREWKDSQAQASWSVFSPDGTQVAYTWFENTATEIRLVNVRPSQPRVLYQAPIGETVFVKDWSPDGKYILAELFRGPTSSAVLLVSVIDGSTRTLPASDCTCNRMQFSKDGRFIAYDAKGQGDQGGDILRISLADSRVESLVRDPADDNLVGWTPDGKRLLFSSNRSGSKGLWAIAVTDGRVASPPELIRPDAEIGSPLGITREGALYYALSTDQNDSYVAELNLESEQLTSPPKPVSPRYVSTQYWPAWSPDGSRLAFLVMNSGTPKIVTVAGTSEPVEINPQINSFFLLQWHPDGRSYLMKGRPSDGLPGIYAVDAISGAATQFARNVPDRPTFSADARKMYWGSGNSDDPGMFSLDLNLGQRTTLYRPPDPVSTKNPNAAVSPDGKWLAIQLENDPKGSNSLAVLPEGGGQPRILVTQAGLFGNALFGANTLLWTPDSQRLLYSASSGNGSEAWIVDIQGGPPRRVGIRMVGEMRGFKLNRDQKRLAFMVNKAGEEIWVMENFLSRN